MTELKSALEGIVHSASRSISGLKERLFREIEPVTQEGGVLTLPSNRRAKQWEQYRYWRNGLIVLSIGAGLGYLISRISHPDYVDSKLLLYGFDVFACVAGLEAADATLDMNNYGGDPNQIVRIDRTAGTIGISCDNSTQTIPYGKITDAQVIQDGFQRRKDIGTIELKYQPVTSDGTLSESSRTVMIPFQKKPHEVTELVRKYVGL